MWYPRLQVSATVGAELDRLEALLAAAVAEMHTRMRTHTQAQQQPPQQPSLVSAPPTPAGSRGTSLAGGLTLWPGWDQDGTPKR